MVSSTARIMHNLTKQVLKPSWLLLFVIPVAVAGIEVTSYQTASTFSQDLAFWRQFLLFGILLPLSSGLTISILSLTNQEQVKTDFALHQLRLAREIRGAFRDAPRSNPFDVEDHRADRKNQL